jgi:hypothetical protein
MLRRLQQNKQEFKIRRVKNSSTLESFFADYMPLLALGILIAACIYPDCALAANLEQQLDKVGAVANGKFKTIGLTAATIGGGIWSVVKGNLKLAGIIVAIGITLSLYLEWIAGGMVVSA